MQVNIGPIPEPQLVPIRYNTIYDFAIAYYNNTHNVRARPGATELYNEIAYYLVCFTMADLSHDFRDLNVSVKLDRKAGSMSIGEHMCGKACEAFYLAASDEWTDLKNETYNSFLNQMGSV